MNLQPREPVILAVDFSALVEWYKDVLGFTVVQRFADDFHYCNLENASGVKLGVALAKEMGVVPVDRSHNTVILQFQVDDVREFLDRIKEAGGEITSGPSLDEKGGFWFGSFCDPEGNPFWVVDPNCP